MTPFGDRAAKFDIPSGASRAKLLERLRAVTGVRDVVLAEDVGCVVFSDEERAAPDVARIVASAAPDDATSRASRAHAISVVYDGADLEAVAVAIGRTREDVVALHSDAEYRVSMLGFLPGFAYLRGLPDELRLPRRAPRSRVPKNSVAIAADYAGIYPFASPGGWHLLGRTIDFEVFDADGAVLSLGDRVRFTPSAARSEEPARPIDVQNVDTTRPHLEILRAAGFAQLVDGGRFGHMHEGVPPGGPLVRSAFERANAVAENAADSCAVEILGTLEVVARHGAVTIADGDRQVRLMEGQTHLVSTVATAARVRYLALMGGVEAPLVLGSRCSLIMASIGHPLRRGARLLPGLELGPGSTRAPPAPAASSELVVDVVAEGWIDATFRVSASSDRTGTRLDGPALALGAMDRRSTPMVLGAIELTPSGLIVLGPDHPTTGGYPVVGVVRSASLDALFSKKPGEEVRFTGGA